MPRRYRKKKRVYRRKRRYNKKSSFNQKLLGNSVATTLVYNDQFSLDAGANPSIAAHVFSANGMFDPDITGVGHQPRGFDEIMLLYDHYVVVGSKMTLLVPTGDSTKIVGIALKDDNVMETTLVGYQEGRYVSSKMMAPDAGGTKIITYGFSAKRFLGRASPMSDPQLKGSDAGNPTEGAFFHVFTGAPRAGVNPSSSVFDVKIEYRVVFIEPQNPGQS